MNFFERQEQARQNTTYLVFLFSVAVLGIIGATVGTVLFGLYFTGTYGGQEFNLINHWQAIAAATAGTLMVILGGALYKWFLLGNSGVAVAEYLGGRPVDYDTKDPNEKKLINVVEEMSIAASVPVPLIYILKNEHSINAFAAGTTFSDAVIGVTTGAVENLSRDELQGVIAHEFSHILNGDCKLNMRLIGYLAGIVTIGIIGRYMLESVLRGNRYRKRSKEDNSAMFGMMLIGFFLMIIGFLGTFVGRLIRAAISRQREFLADASAVQFTRYPAGIAGALAKIQDKSSYIFNGHAEEASHMFIENPINPFLFFANAMATHPPLEQRIAAIDKRFLDSEFLEKNLKFPEETSQPKMHEKYLNNLVDTVGEVTAKSMSHASVLIAGMSQVIREHHGDKAVAQALILAILMREAKNKQIQFDLIETYLAPDVFAVIPKAVNEIEHSEKKEHLAVFELCAPALRLLTLEEQDHLLKAAEYIVRVDRQIDLVEASYLLLLKKTLGADEKRKSLSSYGVQQAWDSIKMTLAALAHHGHADLAAANRAYQNACTSVYKVDGEIPPRSFCDGKSLIAAMNKLSHLKPLDKKLLVEACFTCVEQDGKVTAQEVELLRAITTSLEAPLPLSV